MDDEDKPSYIEQSVDAARNIFHWPSGNLHAHAPAKPGSPMSNVKSAHYNRSAVSKGPRRGGRKKRS